MLLGKFWMELCFWFLNQNKNCLEMFLTYLTNKQSLNLNTELNHSVFQNQPYDQYFRRYGDLSLLEL